MTELLTTLKDALTRNFGYKSVALLFALVFWVWVQSEQRVEDRVRATVEWRLPDGTALTEPPLEQVSVSVEGVQAFVRLLHQRELRIVVDLGKAREGDVSVDLTQKQVEGLPEQVHVRSISPSQLRVTLDRQLKRKVAVAPVTVGAVAPGFRLASVKILPERAELIGAASVLRALDAVSTEDIDLDGLREDVDVDVGLALKKGVEPAGAGKRFTAHVDVEPIIAERTFAEVPVTVREPGWGTAVERVTVKLSGPEEAISGLQPEEVSVVVRVPEGYTGPGGEARAGRTEGLRFEVIQGGGDQVRVVDVSPATIPVTRKETP